MWWYYRSLPPIGPLPKNKTGHGHIQYTNTRPYVAPRTRASRRSKAKASQKHHIRTTRRTDGHTEITDQQIDGPTYGWMERRTDMCSVASLRLEPLMATETRGKEYFCCCSSTGSNSQSECSHFFEGPITAEIRLATSGELRIYRSNVDRKCDNIIIFKLRSSDRFQRKISKV